MKPEMMERKTMKNPCERNIWFLGLNLVWKLKKHEIGVVEGGWWRHREWFWSDIFHGLVEEDEGLLWLKLSLKEYPWLRTRRLNTRIQNISKREASFGHESDFCGVYLKATIFWILWFKIVCLVRQNTSWTYLGPEVRSYRPMFILFHFPNTSEEDT